jgi:hypothetical protein
MFNKDKSVSDGFGRWCKPCKKEYKSSWYAKNAESERSKALKYHYENYENHKEQIKQRNKEYAEKVNYYAKISPEKKKQYARTAYLNHKEKVRKAKELDVGATELVAGYV